MATTRKPWPMRWIVLLIVLFAVPYTYLNLRYRKPGPDYRPYQDAREREKIARAGYARITIAAERPADDGRLRGGAAAVEALSGGLPEDLRRTLIEPPHLPAELGAVAAPAAADSGGAYPIEFECTQADAHQQLGGARIYRRGTDVFVVADFERLAGGLTVRTRRNLIRLTVPPGALERGTYRFVLVGAAASKAWSVQVH